MIFLDKIRKNSKYVLGRNERQLRYIRLNNLRNAIKIADDKVLSKKILKRNQIPVPNKIAVIKSRRELENFDFESLPPSFVIKPVKGVRGSGVEIFYNRDKKTGKWIRADKTKVDINELKSLSTDILDGRFSLFNEPDRILIEERVKSHKSFKQYTYKGTPDIRIIVFNKIPIMAYIRLPTKKSNGKANLDLGAIGAGIDIAVGKTTSSIIGKSTLINFVPDTNIPLSGLKIPYWNKILRYAIEASKVTKLGFAAIDFLIDKEKGPLIVELNARPGLSIQSANDDGLKWRLSKAADLKVKNIDQGIRLGKDLFGGEIEEEIEEISGKQVIGLIQNVAFSSKDGKYKEIVKCKVDTGADSTSIDASLAIRLGFKNIVEMQELQLIKIPESLDDRIKLEKELSEELNKKYEDLIEVQFVRSSHGLSLRPYVNINARIDEFEFEIKASIYNRTNLSFSVILGKNILSKFLIDPSKK